MQVKDEGLCLYSILIGLDAIFMASSHSVQVANVLLQM